MNAIASKRETTGQLARPLTTLEQQARCVELAKQGYSIRAITAELGYASTNSVSKHLEAYRASLTPSSELAESWRDAKLARADERFRRLGAKALGERDSETGEWITEPDYQALAALQKEEDAITKLLGANLEVGVRFSVFTAEAMAAALGWDESQVVEGEAREITDGS